MSVIEHVKVGDLPEAWRERLHAAADARVTALLEEEAQASQATKEEAYSPLLFGMWRNRKDMTDVEILRASCALLIECG